MNAEDMSDGDVVSEIGRLESTTRLMDEIAASLDSPFANLPAEQARRNGLHDAVDVLDGRTPWYLRSR